MCEESASFDLTSFDVASCMKDVTQLLKWKEGERSGMDESYLQDQGGVCGRKDVRVYVHTCVNSVLRWQDVLYEVYKVAGCAV